MCTTELGYMASLTPEFEKRKCKVLGISVDGVSDHKKWSKDIESSPGSCGQLSTDRGSDVGHRQALRHAARGCGGQL